MTIEVLKNKVRGIVERSSRLKDKYIDEKDAPVNYACIFSQSDEEYQMLVEVVE